MVFVELPEVGTKVEAGKAFGVVESVKAVSDIYAPLSGEVIEINEELIETPEVINTSVYEDGWMIVITSYSIHYTKLYERGGAGGAHRGGEGAGRPAPRPAARSGARGAPGGGAGEGPGAAHDRNNFV